jgi:GNAT superfamily N-acetyltransferase
MLLFLILTGSSIKAHDFTLELKELGNNMQRYTLIAPDGTRVASLAVIPCSGLAVLGSPIFDTIDKSKLPVETLNLICAIKAIKTRYELAEVAMVGDLYVHSEYRGKGHARNLLEKTCTQIFSQGFKAVVLTPDPFEYEENKPKLLNDEVKKQQVIKLYQNCGFKKNSEDNTLFMYRDAITTDL